MNATSEHSLVGRIDRPTRRRAGVYARALRRETSRLRDPRRLLAILLLALTGGLMVAFLVARGELAGADARAYWAGVRVWLAGGDPFHPGGVFLPYVYAPWLLPLFLPWALLPWTVAWAVWRGANVLLFLWSAEWAYRRHPLATAIAVVLISLPLIATFDTGNVTLLLTLAVWLAQFSGPRLGGALWALAASMKWFPAALFVFLPPRARAWGLVAGAFAILLALATWPATLLQINTALNFPRPLRIDYVLLLWAAIPWLWRHAHPLWWANRRELPRAVRLARGRVAAAWAYARTDPDQARLQARRGIGARVRAFFGLA
ncbi:MAG: glycosyltransferase family 87 protein [Candidatus Limnocylindrales bacterium]